MHNSTRTARNPRPSSNLYIPPHLRSLTTPRTSSPNTSRLLQQTQSTLNPEAAAFPGPEGYSDVFDHITSISAPLIPQVQTMETSELVTPAPPNRLTFGLSNMSRRRSVQAPAQEGRRTTTFAKTIRKAYQDWGKDCIDSMIGRMPPDLWANATLPSARYDDTVSERIKITEDWIASEERRDAMKELLRSPVVECETIAQFTERWLERFKEFEDPWLPAEEFETWKKEEGMTQ